METMEVTTAYDLREEWLVSNLMLPFKQQMVNTEGHCFCYYRRQMVKTRKQPLRIH